MGKIMRLDIYPVLQINGVETIEGIFYISFEQ
jgi:hypothetical protein